MIALTRRNWTGVGPSDQFLVGNTAKALPDVLCLAVNLKALSSNSEAVFVGSVDDDVTTATGFELLPGDGVRVPVTNINQIAVISASGGQKLCWLAETKPS